MGDRERYDMHHQDDQPRAGNPPAARQPLTFAAPRLELPRFRFASTSAPAPATAHTQHAAQATPRVAAQPARPMLGTSIPLAPPATAPMTMTAAPMHAEPIAEPVAHPAPAWHANATAVAQPVHVGYAPVAPAPVPNPHPVPHRPAPAIAANITRPATTVSWDRLEQPLGERTLLQRISPAHMGVLLVMVVLAMVVTSGPASVATGPTKLSAVSGGGGSVADPLAAPRAGAVTPGTGAKGAAKSPRTGARAAVAARPKVRNSFIRVGNARLARRVRSGGIPSAAASANLAIAGGGRVAAGSTGDVRMDGIPSAAASEQLGPQTLPFRPNDGVTLPRSSGERDGYAVDRHYGTDVLPMEEPVELPAMTPGAAAERAEQQATRVDLAGGDVTPPHASGGLTIAY